MVLSGKQRSVLASFFSRDVSLIENGPTTVLVRCASGDYFLSEDGVLSRSQGRGRPIACEHPNCTNLASNVTPRSLDVHCQRHMEVTP